MLHPYRTISVDLGCFEAKARACFGICALHFAERADGQGTSCSLGGCRGDGPCRCGAVEKAAAALATAVGGRTMVGMLSVFVSSLQRDYSAVRGAVRRAVEILHMRPLMAELVGARPESPQRALLDLMAEA